MSNLVFGIKAVAVLLVASVLVAWLFRREILATSVATPVRGRAAGAGRTPDDSQFAARFYGGDPVKADIAVRVRHVLAGNLDRELPELYPTTRLDDELDAELEANPHLYWDLEKEFGVDFEVDDYDRFCFHVNRSTTFDDLVVLVGDKIRAAAMAPKTPKRKQRKKPVDFILDTVVPGLCIAGLVIVVGGQIVGNDESLRFGTALFLSGFSIVGFISGGTMLRNFVVDVCDLIRNPRRIYFWSTLFVVVLMLFFLGWGLFPLWMIIRMYL